MTMTRVGFDSVAADSITFPAHVERDLIIVFAFNTLNTSAITVPGGWNYVHQNGTSGQSRAIAWKYAQSSSETSGTWTNATHMQCYVSRGTDGPILLGDYSFGVTLSTTSASYGSINQFRKRDGTALVLGAAVTRAIDSNIDSVPPTGMFVLDSALDAGTGECVLLETTTPVSSWSTTVASIGGTANTVTRYTLEIFEGLISLGGGGGGAAGRRDMRGGFVN